jgi:hypothetical protein
VQIGGLLPEGPAPRAAAFESLCGNGYALAQNGLYRLEPSVGSPVGSWVPVPLAAASIPAGYDVGFASGNLIAEGDALWVFSGTGLSLKVREEGCTLP